MLQKIVIAVIDDDEGARDSMAALLDAAGYALKMHGSGRHFLDDFDLATACVIIDVYMPDMGGLELQQELARRSINLPVIFVSGHAAVPVVVQAVKAGAIDFIEKSSLSGAMLESVGRALKAGQEAASTLAKVSGAKMMLARLTPRERNVMSLIVDGRSTKIAAYELGISPRTVEIHRARIMDKIGARNIADVVRVAMMAA